MHGTFLKYSWIMALILTAPFLSGHASAEESKAAKQQRDTTTLQLHISDDGSAIVDQSGKEVARFSEDMRVNPEQSGNKAMQGCMRCTMECIIWEGERCVKKIRSCTWDFDCKK